MARQIDKTIVDIVEGYPIYRYEGEYDSEEITGQDSNNFIQPTVVSDIRSPRYGPNILSRYSRNLGCMVYEHPLIFLYLWGILVFSLGFWLGRNS